MMSTDEAIKRLTTAASGEHDDLLACIPANREKGTMRDWFRAHHTNLVETLQLGRFGVWRPGVRRVDASRASFVCMDDSRRDYAGLRVVRLSDEALLVANDDDGGEVILYAVAA
jgi:hypothetical protein